MYMYLYIFSLFRFFSILISKLKAKKVNCASSKRGQDNKRDFDMFPEKCSAIIHDVNVDPITFSHETKERHLVLRTIGYQTWL